jgi:hypothetical protein
MSASSGSRYQEVLSAGYSVLRMQSVSSCATAPERTPPPGRSEEAMFKAQTRILGLFEDCRMEWTASRVSDFMMRIRGIIGAGGGAGLELELELAADDG